MLRVYNINHEEGAARDERVHRSYVRREHAAEEEEAEAQGEHRVAAEDQSSGGRHREAQPGVDGAVQVEQQNKDDGAQPHPPQVMFK